MISFGLLFNRFLKIGATAYGDPAIVGQMKKTIVKDLGWMRESDLSFKFIFILLSDVWQPLSELSFLLVWPAQWEILELSLKR